MKKIAILILFQSLNSCNNDIVIVTAESNIECAKQLTCFHSESDLNYNFPTENNIINAVPNLNLEYSRYSGNKITIPENIKILKNSKSLNLKNNSTTKVYNVRIQKTNVSGKVAFKDFKIEPTQEICIGCNKDFDIEFTPLQESRVDNYNYTMSYEYILPYEGKVKGISNCSYKIYDTNLISEY